MKKTKTYSVSDRPTGRAKMTLEENIDAAIEQFNADFPGVEIEKISIVADLSSGFQRGLVTVLYTPAAKATVASKPVVAAVKK